MPLTQTVKFANALAYCISVPDDAMAPTPRWNPEEISVSRDMMHAAIKWPTEPKPTTMEYSLGGKSLRSLGIRILEIMSGECLSKFGDSSS
jgi:hypothetical protein